MSNERPWARHPLVKVECGIDGCELTLGQVEQHDRELWWHAEAHTKGPAQLRHERADVADYDGRVHYLAFTPLAEAVKLGPSAWSVQCRRHPGARVSEEQYLRITGEVGELVRAALRRALSDPGERPIRVKFRKTL